MLQQKLKEHKFKHLENGIMFERSAGRMSWVHVGSRAKAKINIFKNVQSKGSEA